MPKKSCQQLRGLILRGEYAVGDKLPPERKLAEELGVNRASLREAIKSLEHMGLVKTRQGDGTRVLDFMQTAGVELVSHLIPATACPTSKCWSTCSSSAAGSAAKWRAWPPSAPGAEDLKSSRRMAEQAADPAIDAERAAQARLRVLRAMTRWRKNRVMQLLINTIRSAVMSLRAVLRAVQSAGAGGAQASPRSDQGDRQNDGEGASKIADAYLKKGTDAFLATVRPQS